MSFNLALEKSILREFIAMDIEPVELWAKVMLF